MLGLRIEGWCFLVGGSGGLGCRISGLYKVQGKGALQRLRSWFRIETNVCRHLALDLLGPTCVYLEVPVITACVSVGQYIK